MVKPLKIRLYHKKCNMQLTLDNKVTVIIGNSATGKSSIHKLLAVKDAKVVKKCSDSGFKIVHLDSLDTFGEYNTFRSEDINDSSRLLPKRVYIIDEGSIRITTDIASVIRNTVGSYFIITARTNLNSLNFDISAVKTLYTRDDGITVLKNFVNTKKLSSIENVSISHCVIEDTGKAKVWFEKLFNDIQIIPAGSTDALGNVSKNRMKYSGGKEQVCTEVEKQIENKKGNILVIFDACSFGCCVAELKNLINRYSDNILILSEYKCWEYVILKSNIFKEKFSEYGIDIPNFEESYYEELLYSLSQSEFSTINHNKGDLSRCYIDKCCSYNRKNKTICKFGLSGNDKFVALLIGTEFEDILKIARRI